MLRHQLVDRHVNILRARLLGDILALGNAIASLEDRFRCLGTCISLADLSS